ncbi:hypothetical protein [Streptomyces nigrescens]|uniref:hypothetical protein n=1 Tax=Streptomyces nigrescens TaxID=1920 RepID=UPI0037026323
MTAGELLADIMERELDAMERVEAAIAPINQLVELYPGRRTVAEVLSDAGRTREDFGLIASDMAQIEGLYVEAQA